MLLMYPELWCTCFFVSFHISFIALSCCCLLCVNGMWVDICIIGYVHVYLQTYLSTYLGFRSTQCSIHRPYTPCTGSRAVMRRDRVLISALYKLFMCVCVCLLDFLPYFFLFLCFLFYLFASLLVYFLTYLSTPSSFQNRPNSISRPEC